MAPLTQAQVAQANAQATQSGPQQPLPPSDDTGLIAVIAAALATGAATSSITAALAPYLIRAGINPQAFARAAAAVAVTIRRPSGVAGRIVAAQENTYRAAYVLAAARRITQAARSTPTGTLSRSEAIRQAITAERRYADLHKQAAANRRATAIQVDTQASRHGLLLGWKAKLDARTSAECRAANGNNFRADRPPLIGYPGSVHPHCRCQPTAPYPHGLLVDNIVGGLPGH